MWQVGPFSSFLRGETHLEQFGAQATRFGAQATCFGALGGLLELVGTIISSSLYLFPLPLPFCKLGLSMTMES